MDNVREDLKKKNIDLTKIGKAARNREVWRILVRASSSDERREELEEQLQVNQYIIGTSASVFKTMNKRIMSHQPFFHGDNTLLFKLCQLVLFQKLPIIS